MEKSLARARAAIRRAVINKNYTSNIKQSFIPRGAIYRNAYAFHQLSSLGTPAFDFTCTTIYGSCYALITVIEITQATEFATFKKARLIA
ncbi:putative glycosyltransferase [Acorus calamus]|uniref:Glycosyltransferase n=1 Tax=Acorus calamus TaxID=4465 RepID=A0AAV9DFF9_ACOCL|nr:putative glycosyltransferase [Acorus calamus]